MTSFFRAAASFLVVLALLTLSVPGLRAQDSDTAGDESSAPAQAQAPGELSPAERASVLLITSDELAEAWKPFADWKTRQGKRTVIVTVSQIGEDYEGADIQQKIKACVLEHAKDKGTKWVVLGGDSQPGTAGHVPDRDTVHVLGRGFRYSDIPTDVYYLSDKSWNANDDQYYGVWQHDAAAISYTNPHGACIGRIPVRTAEDVKNYTAKVIAYESKYPTQKFARSFISTCAVPQADYKTDLIWGQFRNQWDDCELHKFFTGSTPWDRERPGDYQLSPANWAEKINAKTAGKMHMHGHGFLPLWQLEGRGRSATVTARTVNTLRNKDAYLVMTTVSCFTGQYDAAQDPSITESMLRAKDAGAVAIVTPSREGVPIYPQGFRGNRRSIQDGTSQILSFFWKHGITSNLTTGEAFAAARKEMAGMERSLGYHWCLCELNLLGDPTLDMRASDPANLDVRIPERIAVDAKSLTVSVGRAGVTVCIWKGDEVYDVATTNEDGSATFELPAATTAGKLLVTASGPSLNTWTGEIAVGDGDSGTDW